MISLPPQRKLGRVLLSTTAECLHNDLALHTSLMFCSHVGTRTCSWAEVVKHPHAAASGSNCILFMQLSPVRVLTSISSVPPASSCRQTVPNSPQIIVGCAWPRPCLGFSHAPSARSGARSSSPMARVWETRYWPHKLSAPTASNSICACHLQEEHDRRDGCLHTLVTHYHICLLLPSIMRLCVALICYK